MFSDWNKKLNDNFNKALQRHMLFEVACDKDRLWNLYLDSFPEGANPIYRVRREYDCSCCRHFIKNIGGTVYIDDDMNVRSIFRFDVENDTFQPVLDAIADYVESCPIAGMYCSKEGTVGTATSCERDGNKVKTWNHFFVKLPLRLVFSGRGDTIGTVKSQFNATHNVFKRSLNEISLEAIDTVQELISSNTLYKGAEWSKAISELKKHAIAYRQLPQEKRDNYCWAWTDKVGPVLGRIRNHSIGTLLVDISEGMGLDEAVRRYEAIVAPANYKRPKAIFTKKMLEDAKRTIEELGYMDSLQRRFANLDDITVNNILFSNRDAAKRISGSVFDDMMSDVKVDPKKFSRVEEISIEKFISDVLPTARDIEAYVENRHTQSMVSLIAPVSKDAKTMFKWNNGFSWAYTGNMTDSDIRENVKKAGGKVNGVLRFSIQWNDGKEYDNNDLDAHCIEPDRNRIYFSKKKSRFTGGELDIDIIQPDKGEPAVENITWPSKNKMLNGEYTFLVHCFTKRGGRGGFRAEIEFDGQVYRFNYHSPMQSKEYVEVAKVTKYSDGHFEIKPSLSADSEAISRDVWGIKTNQFVPVSVIMYSPNYWDEQKGIGHKHYFFMLKGCVNPEAPNGFYNEFLRSELNPHKHVLEALGGKMAVGETDEQLSGIGFSSTKRNELVVKVKGATERIMRIKF